MVIISQTKESSNIFIQNICKNKNNLIGGIKFLQSETLLRAHKHTAHEKSGTIHKRYDAAKFVQEVPDVYSLCAADPLKQHLKY